MITNRTITKFDYKIVGRSKQKRISSIDIFIDYDNKESDIIKLKNVNKYKFTFDINIDLTMQKNTIYPFWEYEDDRKIEQLNFFCRGFTNFTYKVTKINQYYFNRYIEDKLKRLKSTDEDLEKELTHIWALSKYGSDKYEDIKKALRNYIITQERKNKLLKINELKN